MQRSIVVGAFPQLAAGLRATGQFDAVLEINATSGIRDIMDRIKAASGQEMAFILADNLDCDTGTTNVSKIAGRMASTGYPVLVVDVVGEAPQIAVEFPPVGVIAQFLNIKNVLGELTARGMPGLSTTNPADAPWAEATINPGTTDYNPIAAASQPGPASPSSDEDWQAILSSYDENTPEPAPQAAPQPEILSAPAPTSGAGGFVTPGAPPSASDFATPVAPIAAPVQPVAAGEPLSSPVAPVAPVQHTHAAPAAPVAPTPAPPVAAPVAPVAPVTPVAPVMASAPSAPANPSVGRSRIGQVIVFTSPKGGVGKTQLCVNTASFHGHMMAEEGRRVLYLEGNVQQSDSHAIFFDLARTVQPKTLADICRDYHTLGEQVLSYDKVRTYVDNHHIVEAGIDVLRAPQDAADGNPELITPAFMVKVVEALRPHYDYIYIDTEVANRYADMVNDFALKVANRLVIPVDPNFASINLAYKWINNIIQADPLTTGTTSFDQRDMGVVVNRWRTNTGVELGEIKNELAAVQWLGGVPDATEWQRATNQNRLIGASNYPQLNRAFSEIIAWACDGNDPKFQQTLDNRTWERQAEEQKSQGSKGGFFGKRKKGRK